MEFIKTIINKIKNLFRPRLGAGQSSEGENDLDEIIENSKYDCQTINDLETNNIENKEQFFKMYQAYKEGKIKKENLLITDLIDIELMLLEEENILNDKIEKEEKKISEQINFINNLNTQKSNLEKLA